MDKNSKKGAFVYKSEKNRKSILLPTEYHSLLKFEAMKQKKTLKQVMIEMIRDYLKI